MQVTTEAQSAIVNMRVDCKSLTVISDSTMLMMMAVQYTPLAMLIPLSETVTSGIIKQDTGEAQCVEVLHTIPHSTLTVLMKMVVECITVKHLTAHLHGTPLIMYMEPMSTD